jgi:hypothetical protein
MTLSVNEKALSYKIICVAVYVETIWVDPSLFMPRPNVGKNKIDHFCSTSLIIP